MRLQGYATWELVVFLLNGVLFVLIGLQLPHVLDGRRGLLRARADRLRAASSARAVIVVRFLDVHEPYVVRALDRRPAQVARRAGWRERVIVAWSGMRGGVSLAAALAIPLETDAGAPFPERDLIIFITFCVILVTLVGQGLTLPLLIRKLGVHDDGAEEQEELHARLTAAKAALTGSTARGGGLGTRGHPRADARHVPLPQAALRRAGREDRGRRLRGPRAAYQRAVRAGAGRAARGDRGAAQPRARSRTT